MTIGKIKFYNDSKGFGFITPEDGSKDVFVHASGLPAGKPLREGDKISYEIFEGDKGSQAIKVQLI